MKSVYYHLLTQDTDIFFQILFTAPYIKQCREDDPDLAGCIMKAIDHLRPYLRDGESNFSIFYLKRLITLKITINNVNEMKISTVIL